MSLLRGSLTPFGRAPKAQISQFKIPLHYTTGLKARGFGLGTCGRTSSGWFYNPITKLWEEASSGEERIDAKGLLVEPASTNYCLQSRAFDTASWTSTLGSLLQNEDGIDGSSTTAWTLIDDSTDTIELLYQTISVSDDSNTHTFSVFIKKTQHFPTFFPAIQIYFSGGTDKYARLFLNTKTGGYGYDSNYPDNYDVEDYGDWWRVWISLSNNNSGNTSCTVAIIPSLGTLIDTADVSATGSCVIDFAQFEKNQKFPTSPITTTSSSATRITDAGNYTWPIPSAVSTMLADSGTLVCVWTPHISKSDWIVTSTNEGYVSTKAGSSSIFYVESSAGIISSYDNTTSVLENSVNYLKGVSYPICVRWGFGSTEFEIGIKDVDGEWYWGSSQSFDGAYTDTGTLTLGYSIEVPFHIQSVHLYNLLTQSQIEEII